MTPCEIEAAREKYNYIPARLIRAGDYVAADLTWKSLKLIMDVPTGWDVEHQQIVNCCAPSGKQFSGLVPSWAGKFAWKRSGDLLCAAMVSRINLGNLGAKQECLR
jgi:hypothetical protein